MGVSGCGKSTVGALLGERLGMPFQDGDDLHPAANKAKMGAGIPLNDIDRMPWLDEIGEALRRSQDVQKPLIIACSALKRCYRDLLRSHVRDVVFIHLVGERKTLVARMNARAHEFMPTSLLDSQLRTLEPLAENERHILADLTLTPSQLVDEICSNLQEFATH
ncbi:gluconokinase [Arthrobacter sp. CDRTa11]|uniref:gluconokinase n=1 Tax=Arthrobacter sp. CDRTa11 TaxID=2651199 RepID=UPI002265A274|nr:gluconokinase [Arthrobacter sp. CDRTa11]UZX05419.1 gluconokinase [Arthrobacter sp. CDRTa11]